MAVRQIYRDGSALVGTVVLTALLVVLHPSAAEADAVSKAKCVRQAIKSAAKIFTPDKEYTGGRIAPDVQARARKEMDAFEAASRTGLQKCLAAEEVSQLGWFAFLEIAAPGCRIRKTDALKSYYLEDNLESDLINGAAGWEKYDTDISNHPFFKGQAAARARFASEHDVKRRAELMCDDMLRGFGPTGDKFPGLVRRQ